MNGLSITRTHSLTFANDYSLVVQSVLKMSACVCVCQYFPSQTNKCFITIKLKYDKLNKCYNQPDLLVCVSNNTNSLSTPSSSPLASTSKITSASSRVIAATSVSNKNNNNNINTNLLELQGRKSKRFHAELLQIQQIAVDGKRDNSSTTSHSPAAN